MIQIQHLLKIYGKKSVLDIPKLDISSSEIFGLTGNNGSGKTTLLRLMLYLIKPERGRILIDGVDIFKNDILKESGKIGSYLNDKYLIPYLTPMEYYNFIRKIYNIAENDFQELLLYYSNFLTNKLVSSGKLIRELSTGNKNKLGIVAAMLNSPKILLLDEPFANLDPTSQQNLNKILLTFNKEHNSTIIISSHNLDYTVKISTRIGVLHEGKLIHNVIKSEETLPLLKRHFRA